MCADGWRLIGLSEYEQSDIDPSGSWGRCLRTCKLERSTAVKETVRVTTPTKTPLLFVHLRPFSAISRPIPLFPNWQCKGKTSATSLSQLLVSVGRAGLSQLGPRYNLFIFFLNLFGQLGLGPSEIQRTKYFYELVC